MKLRLPFILVAGAIIAGLAAFHNLPALFSANYLPHRFCYLAQPGLIWTNVVLDGLIAASYVVIFASLLWIAARLKQLPDFSGYLWIFVSFGLFIIACAATHAMEIVTVWWPVYPLSAAVKAVCAAASVPTAVLFARAAPALEVNLRRFLAMLVTAEEERDQARTDLIRSEALLAELREAQIELAAANQTSLSFRLMVDAVVDYAVLMLTPEGIIATWNPGAEHINGYSAREIVGSHFSVFYTPEDLASGLPARELATASSEGRSEDEGWRLRKDGSQFWANVVITAIRDASGKLIGFGKLARDLTEHRDAERTLQEINRQLNSVFECTSDGIMTIDRDWRIVYGNSRAMESLPDFSLGKSYWSCFPAIAGTNIEALLRRSMDLRVQTGYEIFYEPYRTWFRARIFPSDHGITAFFTDVTEEKLVQQELAAANLLLEERILELHRLSGELTGVNQLLSSVMDSTTEGIFHLGFDWTIVSANRMALNLPGVELGSLFWDCFPTVASLPLGDSLSNSMAQRARADFSLFYEPFQSWFKGQLCPTPEGLAIFFQDISAEKLLEAKLAEEQLLREKRIEVLSVMAGGLAHEISNPLAIIHARASDLKLTAEAAEFVPAAEVKDACDSIVNTSDRAIKILRGLKGFGRDAGSDPMEYASIYEIADQALDVQYTRFERHHIELRISMQPGIPLILCREVQVGQIITNLLNNAFDAITHHQSEVRWVALNVGRDDADLYLDVIDSGPGVDPSSRAHLMDPFFTTKKGGLGMGVGLSLSRAIAQDHNASLMLCDDPVYTRFRLLFPLPVEAVLATDGVNLGA